MAAFAALMGACVFLSDQERRHFRFFVEHNVPPRYVWLTRQTAWLGTLLGCDDFHVVGDCSVTASSLIYGEAVQSLTDSRKSPPSESIWQLSILSYHFRRLAVYLSCIAVSYSRRAMGVDDDSQRNHGRFYVD